MEQHSRGTPQERITTDKSRQNHSNDVERNKLADVIVPSVDRRKFLQLAAAVSGVVLASPETPAIAMVQAQDKGPEKANRPGIDSPLSMSTVTVTGHVYDSEAIKKPIKDAEVGRAPFPSQGGALQLAGLAVERVGRENIPVGHVMRISVVGAQGEHIFVIDPAKVPSSDFTKKDYDQAIRGPEKDAELAKFVQSLGTGKLGVQLLVSGKQLGDPPSVNFDLIKDKLGTPATLSVQFVDPATLVKPTPQ